MGAIFGYVGFEDNNLVRKMSRPMRHRSMDGYRYYKNKDLVFGQGISKIGADCSPGPIISEDGDIVLLFDGRVFRADKIRSSLESEGHEFKTGFSGEVILHLYEECGMKFLNRINGDFGFCLYDSGKRKLFLCSDNSGSRPIYYHENGRALVFASDIKPILQYDVFERKLDEYAFNLFLTYLFLPTEKTMLQGIRRVMPSTYVVFDSGSLETVRYFEIKENIDNTKSEEYFIKKTRAGLERAIDDRFIDGVPIHMSLGGLDSSAVVGILSSRADVINTHTIRFDNEFDEGGFAREVSEMHGTSHHEFYVDGDSIEGFYKKMLANFNSPSVINMVAISLYSIFSKMAGKRSLFFNGEGADEVFGGLKNESMLKYRSLLNMPKPVRNFISKSFIASANGMGGFADFMRLNKGRFERSTINEYAKFLKELVSMDRSYANLTPTFYFDGYEAGVNCDGKDLFLYRKGLNDKRFCYVNRLMKMDTESRAYLDGLARNEIICSSRGLLNNCPFLDKELIIFSFKVPMRYKFRRNSNKALLAKATKNLFPKRDLIGKGLFTRGALSVYNDYFTQNRSLLENLFEKSEVFNMFRRDFLDKNVNQLARRSSDCFSTKGFYRISKIHTLLSLGLWYEHYFNDEKISNFF